MSSVTEKFDKVLSSSEKFRHIEHEPNSYHDQQKNTPQKSLPFSDQIGNYQRNKGIPNKSHTDSKVYIVGSGIAGLSAAYYFIRDGHIPGANITFLERSGVEGGALDGAGNPKDGYIVRGGREMDMSYENLFDMLQDIPAFEMPAPYSVLDEYRLLNDHDPNYSKARLIHRQGVVQDFSKFNLSRKDQRALTRLLLKKKEDLDDLSIEQYFKPSFFESTFWTFWRTMFAFENWHSVLELKLYMHRFLHAIDGLHDMSALVFPKYNQYDTFVRPIRKMLKNQGVCIQHNTLVKDLDMKITADRKIVRALIAEREGNQLTIPVREQDFVIITTGSMTEDTRYGDCHNAPYIELDRSDEGFSPGWTLWRNLAKKSSVFGKPEKFCGNRKLSAWESATLTCKPSALIDKLKELSVNDPYSGKTVTGGIITVTDSEWLMSFTCNRQPHFPDQPDDVLVLWVYGLFMDKKGNYIQKNMPECTGHEILTELCYHLGIIDRLAEVLCNTIVRTAYMPYITSMFMPRAQGDRPKPVPEGCKNLGLVGQFVETSNDVVFTVETSVRTGRIAAYSLLNSNKQVPDIYPSQYDVRHLLKALKTLNDGKGFWWEKILRNILRNTYFEHILP